MNLDDFRQRVVSKIETEAVERGQNVLDLRSVAFPSTDAYALAITEMLSESRGLVLARKIVDEEFKKLERPEQRPEENAAEPRKGDVY